LDGQIIERWFFGSAAYIWGLNYEEVWTFYINVVLFTDPPGLSSDLLSSDEPDISQSVDLSEKINPWTSSMVGEGTWESDYSQAFSNFSCF
jgi:hypothetical protein